MKILLLKDKYEMVKNSGVGKAIKHQEDALKKAGVDFTCNSNEKHDIVHINTVFPSSWKFAKKSIKAGVPVVYHAHSTMEDFKDSFRFSNIVAPFFKKWILKCYKTSDLILTPTYYSKKLLEGYGLDRRIEVVSNGIDLDFWKSKENDRKNFIEKYKPKSDKIIVSVGLYIRRKGILDFVELAKRLPQYDFYWFGYLDLNLVPAEIKEAVKTDLPNLHFPGYVNSDELRMAYSASDLYFFPTYEETEGIVLLEALATKTNTLIRDIEIYEDDFIDGVNIYKGKNIEEFEEKITLILENKLKNLTEEGYKVAKERSIEAVGNKLKSLYEELLW